MLCNLDIIKNFEGKVINEETDMHTAYLCPANYWTIGYGSLIFINNKPAKFPNIRFNDIPDSQKYITEEIANRKLYDFVQNHARKLHNIMSKLNYNQRSALLSFSYNIGVYGTLASTLYRVIKSDHNNFPEIQKQFMRWIYCNGKKNKGLINRRSIESGIYVS